jgi:hypothetical protein
VHFLVSKQAAESRLTNGWLEVTVPSILDHEVVAVDLA